MPANVETMFYVREAPWHGLGVRVESALNSEDALVMSGLNWNVIQRPIMTTSYTPIPGYKANIRDTDNRVLGVVTDRYRVVQNAEAFAFTDALLGEGVRYETAGSLQDGKKIWILAKLPDKYIIEGDQIDPYLVFSSSHNGSGSIKVAMTPVRVVCQNTLNLALGRAKRVWATVHVGDLAAKMDEDHNTLLLAEKYMGRLGMEFSRLSKIKLSDQKVMEYIDLLLPMDEQYDEACEQLEEVTERKQKAENLLKEMLGENEVGTSGSRIITWKSVSQERLDSKTLKAEHPALCKKYTNKTSYRRFTIKAAS